MALAEAAQTIIVSIDGFEGPLWRYSGENDIRADKYRQRREERRTAETGEREIAAGEARR